MERGLRTKTNIIEDESIKFFDKMDIEMKDETIQVLNKLSKEWNNLPQEDKDKIIDIVSKLPS